MSVFLIAWLIFMILDTYLYTKKRTLPFPKGWAIPGSGFYYYFKTK